MSIEQFLEKHGNCRRLEYDVDLGGYVCRQCGERFHLNDGEERLRRLAADHMSTLSWVYDLKTKEVYRQPDLVLFSEFMKRDRRIVEQTEVGDLFVSTVFLGIDHRLSEEGPPLVFETMVFDNSEEGKGDTFADYCERYSTWDEAVAGHRKVLEAIGIDR